MSTLEHHRKRMHVHPGGYIALAVIILMVAGCTKNYGHFSKSAEVDLAFRQGDHQPDYQYFYAGRDNMPYAIIGIDREYTVPSRYWIPFKPDSETLRAKTRPAHLEYAAAIREKIIFAGPTLSEDGSKMTASVWVIEAGSFEEAREITAQDPFEQAGLFASKEIHRFMQVIPEDE